MQEIFVRQNKNSCYLHIEKWHRLDSRLRVGFTMRLGGVSEPPYDTFNLGFNVTDDDEHVVANRKRLAEKLSIPLQHWVGGEQVHGNHVCIIHQGDRNRGAHNYRTSIEGVDGLITNELGILCTAFFADCVPLFFYDPTTGYIGIAHAGWKGTVRRIAEKMVQTFSSQGVDPAHLLVTIGPSISQEKYEVDDNVMQHIDENLQKKTGIQRGHHRYLLDLKQLNVEILLQCGVIRHNIEVTNYCTYTDDNLFFSHRRDHGKTGRMLGFIGYTL
ncbi:MAG TPA: peptidoglycan editing factor PgeF [Bacillota bacterium]